MEPKHMDVTQEILSTTIRLTLTWVTSLMIWEPDKNTWEISSRRTKPRLDKMIINKGFKNAIYWVVQYIDDFDQLKWAVNKNLYPYVKDQEMKNVEIDPDIKKEYENQRKYLENSQASLKKRLEKEQ